MASEIKVDTIVNAGGDNDSGIDLATNDVVKVKTANTERMRIDASGNVGIGETDISGFGGTYKGLDVAYKGSGLAGRTDNPTFDMRSNLFYDGSNYKYGEGSTSAGILSVGGNQLIFSNAPSGTAGATATVTQRFRVTADGIYGDTTSSAADVQVDSTGTLRRSTSSRRYKNTINDATHGLADLNKLRSVTFKGNNDGDTVFGGLIAEEVHDAGLTEFVVYDDDNKPDALHYTHMIALCVKSIQELSAKNDALEARLKKLEDG